jgi:hypothetical protein
MLGGQVAHINAVELFKGFIEAVELDVHLKGIAHPVHQQIGAVIRENVEHTHDDDGGNKVYNQSFPDAVPAPEMAQSGPKSHATLLPASNIRKRSFS